MVTVSSGQIVNYANDKLKSIVGLSDVTRDKITNLPGGDYNFNYRVETDAADVVIRLCIEPQSGRADQIAYEYRTLQILEPAGVTPRPLFIDESRTIFPYDILVEQYIDGGHLVFSIDSVRRVAKAMAQLHSIPIPEKSGLIARANPLREQYDAAQRDLERYSTRHSINPEILRIGAELLRRVQSVLPTVEHLFRPTSIIHTDPNPANIIDNGNQVYFIDWEQGRIDDPSYDVGAFFSDVLNRWASPRILTHDEKNSFLETYTTEMGNDSIRDKIALRVALYTLNASVWAANRIADVDEGKIDKNLGSQNYERYKAMANPEELQKVASSLID